MMRGAGVDTGPTDRFRHKLGRPPKAAGTGMTTAFPFCRSLLD